MKITKKFLNNKYNELYNLLKNIIKEENPCKITCSGCIGSLNFCCTGCKYLGKNGCKAKALTCKTWFCFYAEVSNNLNKERSKVITEMKKYGFYIFRGSKKDSLKSSYLKFNL